jgi:hypothetical protein
MTTTPQLPNIPGHQQPPTGWNGIAGTPPKKRRRWPWIVGGAVVLVLFLGVGLGAAFSAGENEPASSVAAATAQALKPPVISTPADVAKEVRMRGGLECNTLKPIPDPVGAVARSSCAASRGEMVISTYANSADVDAQWKSYSETITKIDDADMAVGDNWTVSGDDSAYIRKAAEVLGGSYMTAGKAAAPVTAPVPADFKLAVKVTRKQCFGSAGCNVDYEIDMTYAGDPLALGDGRSYEVTYEVKGAEDQIIGTLDIQGDSYSSTEESTQTAKSSAKLTAVATSVTER